MQVPLQNYVGNARFLTLLTNGRVLIDEAQNSLPGLIGVNRIGINFGQSGSQPLEVHEEEGFVLDDRAAQAESGDLLDELRARGISVMNANHDLLTTMYRAFNARNLDEILPVLHPEVDWPNGMEGGRVFGREGVREYWTRQWKMIDPHVEPVGFEDVDGRTAVNVHQTVRDLSGNVLADQMVRHVYEIRDGLVVSMEIVPGG